MKNSKASINAGWMENRITITYFSLEDAAEAFKLCSSIKWDLKGAPPEEKICFVLDLCLFEMCDYLFVQEEKNSHQMIIEYIRSFGEIYHVFLSAFFYSSSH